VLFRSTEAADNGAQKAESSSPKDAKAETKDTKDATDTKAGKDAKDTAESKVGKDDKAGKDTKTGKDDKATPEVTSPTTPPTIAPPVPVVEVKLPAFKALPATQTGETLLGSLDAETDRLQVTLTPVGAAILEVLSNHYKTKVKDGDPYRLAGQLTYRVRGNDKIFESPMSAWSVIVNGTDVALFDKKWNLDGPGVYSIVIADTASTPVLKITRTYTLDHNELTCATVFENLSGQSLDVVWRQNAIGDVSKESQYRGDARQVKIGYYDLGYDDQRFNIVTNEGTFTRQSMLDDYQEQLDEGSTLPPFWPSEIGRASCRERV